VLKNQYTQLDQSDGSKRTHLKQRDYEYIDITSLFVWLVDIYWSHDTSVHFLERISLAAALPPDWLTEPPWTFSVALLPPELAASPLSSPTADHSSPYPSSQLREQAHSPTNSSDPLLSTISIQNFQKLKSNITNLVFTSVLGYLENIYKKINCNSQYSILFHQKYKQKNCRSESF